MEVTQDTINTLLAMNEAELQKTFRSIAAVLGMNERMAAANAERFRLMLATSNPKDIERLLSSIPSARAEQIIKTVNEKKS